MLCCVHIGRAGVIFVRNGSKYHTPPCAFYACSASHLFWLLFPKPRQVRTCIYLLLLHPSPPLCHNYYTGPPSLLFGHFTRTHADPISYAETLGKSAAAS